VNVVANLLTLQSLEFVELRLKIRLLHLRGAKWYCTSVFRTKPTKQAALFKHHAVNLLAGDGLFESHKGRGLS